MIADEVELEDASERFRLAHIVHATPDPAALPDGCRLLESNRLGIAGHDLLAAPDAFDDALQTLEALGIGRIPEAVAESLRLERAVARWGVDFDSSSLPAEAGIEARAVSFDKGCYIGQEVVSRIASVGSPSRLLRLLAPLAPGDRPPSAGDRLYAEPASAKACGEITSGGFSFALDKPLALGYLKRGANQLGMHVFAEPKDGGPRVEIEIINPIES